MENRCTMIGRLCSPSQFRALMMSVIMLLFCWPKEASACAPEDTWRYTVMLEGSNQLRLNMPLYDKDDNDCWIVEGTVYIQIEGESTSETLIHYKSEQDISGSNYAPKVTYYRGVDGTMTHFRDRGYSTVTIGKTESTNQCPMVDNQSYAIMNILWDIPSKYRGKKVTISWSIHHNGNFTEKNHWINIDKSSITIPAAPDLQYPMLMDPIISYETGNPNQVMVPYMLAATNISSMKAHYTEVYPSGTTEKTVTLPNTTSDFVRVPADVCIKDFYVEATYLDIEDRSQTTSSSKIDLPILHHPKSLSAVMQPNGKVLLKWRVNNVNWQDLSTSDCWEVQRNVTGDPTNNQWTSLGQIVYDEAATEVTYEDADLLSFYQQQPVYYRVRRVITAIWDWSTQSGYATTMLPGTLALPGITEATVSRNGTWSDLAHEVVLKFDDKPLPPYDNNNRLILRNAQDWINFAAMVNAGKTGVQAMMACDIDLGDVQDRVAENSSCAYKGIFFGNGHKLTVHYDLDEYAAPFAFLGNGIIKDLHVSGTIKAKGKYAAGIAGSIVGTGTIERCRSSVAITSTISGDATNGGLVGLVSGEGDLAITNSLFDGSLLGGNCNSNSGFAGWVQGRIFMNTCLFAPQKLATQTASCATFSRNKSDAETCYYTVTYGTTQGKSAEGMSAEALAAALGTYWEVVDGAVVPIKNTTDIAVPEHNYDANKYLILRDSTDWETFVQLVKEANGEKDVNAIMAADISTSVPVGLQNDVPYRGTFNGNGHTLTVNIDGGQNAYTAPFVKVSNCTIQNLRVCGYVNGGIHSAGLIGNLMQNGVTAHVFNCHISTNITATGNDNNAPHSGGIIGHGHSAKCDVQHCLFDGVVTANNATNQNMDDSWVGALVGWEDGGTSNYVEYNLEMGSYNNFVHNATCANAKNGGHAWGSAHNYNTHNWGDSNKANGIAPDEVATALGDQWQVVGGSVLPIIYTSDDNTLQTLIWDDRSKTILTIKKYVGTEERYTETRELTSSEFKERKLNVELNTACVDHEFFLSVDQGESTLPLSVQGLQRATKTDEGENAVYKFDNNVLLGKAKADTLQSSVSLSWECTRGQADYFRIKRFDKQNPDEVTVLEEEYTEMAYIDRNVRPQHNYTYIIEGVTQCEGNNVSSTTVDGCCVPTGMIRGYVRLANGVGLPHYTVTAKPMDNIVGGEIMTTETDSTGFFEIGGLVYQKYGEYTLSVSDPSREASFESQIVTFDEDVNLQSNIVFTQTNYYLFSGFVLYEGSSIPVSGVRFLRDGVEVVNSSGKPVTTNNQGAFEVSIPQGSHQIQIVKDGHVFLDNGFYITEGAMPDSTWHNWQKDVSGVYLWDQTKVNLMGRVVGGNIQGTKELGKSLSTNNLGDNITMVVQLEGDNTSWIVRDQLNSSVTERHSEVPHGVSDTTKVDEYRHRIVIYPDVKTGEYCLPMYPVKFKVTEIYADGYSTLFQTGMVSETIDLNNYANGDTAVYSRIYHAQPTLDIWQFNGTQDRFYGMKQYTAMDNAGIRDTVTLWRKDGAGGIYTLGYPVFMADASVPMVLSAREEYRYNNDAFGNLDIVQLEGGHVTIGNGLVGYDQTDEVELDSVGQGSYVFTPKNLTFMLEDQMALRTLKFTLEYDGSFYDIAPINAYVMASQPKAQGRRIIAGQNVHLIDILRDPPGASSSAYIAKGSKMSYSYTADYTVMFGLNMKVGTGSGADFFTGIWAGLGTGTEAGSVSSSDNLFTLSYDLATANYQDWEYEYEFTTNEKISTSTNVNEVGMNSDVYIGVTDNVIVEDAVAVRAVNSAALARLRPGVGGTTTVNGHDFNVTGTAKVLARGWDPVVNDSVYLIRDEVMQLSSKLSSTFVHSQKYLLDELIPTLIRTRNSLLMDSTTTSTYAQQMAEKLHRPVYVSTVATDSENFALSDYYDTYNPSDTTQEWTDSIQALNSQIQTWAGFIAANEKEKIEARDLVRVYDFDGRSSVDYSETFTSSDGEHRYWKIPSVVNLGGDGLGKSATLGNQGTTGGDNPITAVGFKAGGIKFSINITPIFSFDFNYKNGMNEGYTKETGFSLSCARQSNLSVGVYKTRGLSNDSIAKLAELGEVGYFYKHVEDNLKDIYNGRPGSSNTTSYIGNVGNVPRYRNFVFRTLAGATCSPWEEERRTLFYNPGTILDHGTEQINKLRIWAKDPSVSNVPYGEPARFTIYMANESDLPNRVSHKFNVYLETDTNPKGAKIFIDGAPLTTTGLEVWLEANEVVEKQVEIYAAAEYDYEDLGISLFDEEDYAHIYTVNLSAHYVPAAGAINISKPGDKWVVNTESAYDEDQMAYYLPVHIDGFDVNFRNFDHIELQYKLSNQGDKDWVNICSYYRNNEEGEALMALASGEKQLMEHDGYIDAFFYGETDPIEQCYDIRAVTFCRHGNGYLTRSSNILSGIKDTRRPQLFGTPQPTDGILGIGEDIVLRFSEQIAGNYLSAVNNFQVVGQTNSSNISLSSSLRFNGKDVAVTQAPRNLDGRSFTVDVMLNPEHNGKGMTILSHGSNTHALELGLTEDHRLTAAIQYNDTVPAAVFTADEPCTFDGLREVFFLFDTNIEEGTTKISFYDGNTQVGSCTYPNVYQGTGNIVLGGSANRLLEGYEPYTGDMLEYRLWNHALTDEEMNSYRQKKLTGYELGLLDNYPLNEGKGDYSYNRTSGGSDLMLVGTSWKMPDGIGMKLDGEKGFRLNNQQFNRFEHQDYTMMFWFRTKDANGTLFSNGTATTELGAKSHFNFAVADSVLVVNLSGLKLKTNSRANDGKWHHVAMTVNRARNVGCLYFDDSLAKTFAVDTIGGISGNLLAAGATYLDANTVENAIHGHIDEIAMYEMALTPNGIKNFSSITPSGEEKGLLAYLNFSKNERQMSNEIKLVPSGVSLRRYKDTTTGEFTSQSDTIVAEADVMRLYDTSDFAPMHDTQTLENIKFSYVADGKDLLVNLDVPDAKIEKTNVYVVVNDVADMQGNIMASPVVLDLYVYRNPLRWSDKRMRLTANYGEEQTFEATVKNLSGKTRNFTLQGLPLWMTASVTSGSVAALDEEVITFTISPYTNIGDYEEVIYLVGEDDMTEPLPITLKVRGTAPEWAVDEDLLHTNITMNLIGQVKIKGAIANDPDDMLAVFNEDHRLLGVTHLVADANSGANDGLAYLNIYNNNYAEIDLYFEFFDASTGIIHRVMPDRVIKFKHDTVVGKTTDPVLFLANNGVVQTIQLQKGWNWVSFNVTPPTSTVKSLLNSATKWEVGDALEAERADGSYNLLSYKATPNPYDPNTPIYAWDCADSLISIDAAKMYRFYSNSSKIGYVYGFTGDTPITVRKGWNRIGFVSEFNLPVGTALAQYTEKASDGDIIKSQSEFAVLSVDALGNKQWRGSLEYLRVGEGYMLKRNQDDEVTFRYPVYFYGSRYNNSEKTSRRRMPAFQNVSGSSMTVVAVAEGVDVLPGDRLTVYNGAELCGIAEADEQGVFYLNVGGVADGYQLSTLNSALSFTLEREGETIAATSTSQMNYVVNAAIGTPDEPTAISFLPADKLYGDGWYTVSGIKLSGKPSYRGIYIYNGQKITIK